MTNRSLLPSLLLTCLLAGCTNIGAGTVARDRFDYSSAIAESWKRQTLLNIVKLRYLDPPVFVDVGQIVAGYTLESAVSGGASMSGDPAGAAVGGIAGSLGGSMRFTDRPTVTYVPLTGNKFVRAMMTPLPPEGVFSTIPAGWPADRVLGAALSSINGLNNTQMSLSGITPPDPKFVRVLELLAEIQRSGAISMRVRKQGDTGGGTLFVIRHATLPEIQQKSAELRGLLGLNPEAREFQLVFGANQQNDHEIAVVTRSQLHMMQMMSASIDVPESDIAEGRAMPGFAETAGVRRMAHIHCSDETPAEAFVSVLYRGRTFWIDDRDLPSKRAFAFMMMLFTLSDPASQENAPMLTIPA